MARLGVPRRTLGETQTLHRPALLDDRTALAEAVRTQSVAEIAAELAVAAPTVHVAMRRLGVRSPWKFDGWNRLTPPDQAVLAAAWAHETTVKGVARRFEVSVNTAAIWLARIGVFVTDTPAISRTELLGAIERGDSIETIRRRHRVTGRTVVVELHRHGLHDAHHRRHMTD
jgi:hypothetical protein